MKKKLQPPKQPILCSNCGKTIYARALDTCTCSLWHRGTKKEAGEPTKASCSFTPLYHT